MYGYGGTASYGGRPTRSLVLRDYLDAKKSQAQQPQAPVQPTYGNQAAGRGAPMGSAYTPPPTAPPPAPALNLSGQTPYASQGGSGGISGMRDRLTGQAMAKYNAAGNTNPYNWTQEELQGWNDLAKSLQNGPDFAGKNAMYHTLLSQYEQLINSQRGQPAIDYSGSSEVADQFTNQRERAMNDLAASGMSGSGVMAGVLGNSYSGQAKAMGSFYRDAQETRRKEKLQQMNEFLRYVRGMQGQGLDRVYAKEDEPGFWQDASGALGSVAGGVGGFLIGGPPGAVAGAKLGGSVGGQLGGQNQQQTPMDYQATYEKLAREKDYSGLGDMASEGNWWGGA